MLDISVLIYSASFSARHLFLHLLPRAQASSLPKKPPPMIVMDFTFLETLSRDLKSSICGKNKKQKLNLEQQSDFFYVTHSKTSDWKISMLVMI